jgi:integrase
MTVSPVLDAAGRRRSPATIPGYHAGRPPRHKGQLYPADPPTVEEIIAVMRKTGDDRHGFRLRALIVVLWRGGLRIQEALALGERDLDHRRGSLLVRNGKGGRPTGGRGRARTSASSFAGSPPKRASGAASRHASCATPAPSSSPARASRST